jgi:hypothetical protein
MRGCTLSAGLDKDPGGARWSRLTHAAACARTHCQLTHTPHCRRVGVWGACACCWGASAARARASVAVVWCGVERVWRHQCVFRNCRCHRALSHIPPAWSSCAGGSTVQHHTRGCSLGGWFAACCGGGQAEHRRRRGCAVTPGCVLCAVAGRACVCLSRCQAAVAGCIGLHPHAAACAAATAGSRQLAHTCASSDAAEQSPHARMGSHPPHSSSSSSSRSSSSSSSALVCPPLARPQWLWCAVMVSPGVRVS